MKIEMLNGSSTSNFLTNLLRAGQRTKQIDTRYFWIQERFQDRELSIKKVLAAKHCADVGTKPDNMASLHVWYSISDGLQDEGDEAYDGSGEGTVALI